MTSQFLKHVIELGNNVFPTTVQNQVTAVVLDYLGVTLAGSAIMSDD